ncbi:MAG: universal stress protein [Bacillaceae bacterium]|nr:universal stress protein [Bacillaceae bacterium]
MLTFYSRIQVAYDGSELSEKALDMAITLAKQDKQVQLGVTHVITSSSHHDVYGMPEVDLLESAREEAHKLMEDVKKKLDELPNKTRTYILEGNPGKVLVDFAKKNDVDLIIIGSRGLSGFKEFFMGSVSHHVVQKSHCPVLVVK